MATPLFPVVILGYLILQWVPSLVVYCKGAERKEKRKKDCVKFWVFSLLPERDPRVVEAPVRDGPAVLDLT